ncbi:MAG: permease [Candidatus Sphingomonas colombiensis]|nr:permease [Sphingomonas sp.]WEK44486.1 MAG: permease [Sphingomonas sp.]
MAHSTARLLDDTQDGRAMIWVIAIMLFLTVLAAAMGLATRNAAATLERSLAGRLTVQLTSGAPGAREAQAARLVTRLRGTAGVTRVTPVSRAALAELLRPWLGTDGVDPNLPLPVMIDVDLADGAPATLARVRAAVTASAPAARIDLHAGWMTSIAGMLSLATWLGAGLVALMATATATVVVLTARAGLDAHRATIEVMHMLGATDVQVARLFQRRIARDALIGGAIGAVAAIAVVLLIGVRAAGLGSELLGGAALGIGAWVMLALLPLAFVVLAMIAARVAVTRTLRRIL